MQINRQKVKLTFTLAIILILLCSCQPTPEKSSVQNKANDEFEQALNGTDAARSSLEIPKSISESFSAKTKNVTIEIKAHPQQAAASTMPVSEYGQGEISTALVKKIAEYFGNGAVFYELPSTLTKAQIMSEIKETEKVLDEDRLEKEYGDDEVQKEFVRSIALIKYRKLKELYKDAPDTAEKAPATFEFRPYVSFMNQAEYAENYAAAEYFAQRGDESAKRELKELEDVAGNDSKGNRMWCEGVAALPSGFTCYVSAQKLSLSNSSSCGIGVTIGKALGADGKPIELYDTAYDKSPLTVSEEEAKAMAGKAVSELGFDDFSLADFNKVSAPGMQGYYSVIYRRMESDGIRTIDFFAVTNDSHSVNLRPEYGTESLSFIITDNGIVQFNINCPLNKIRTVNSAVQIKAFNEIYEIFKSHCTIRYDNILDIEYDENNKNPVTHYADETAVSFSDISLCTLRVIKKGETSIYYIIPVWVFEGKVIREKTDIGGDKPERFVSQTAVIINAIDGSIISSEDCY